MNDRESDSQVEDTEDIDVLDTILDEVRKIRAVQERQANELETIKGRLDELTANSEIVRVMQMEYGKELGSLERRCVNRFESCSQAIKKL